MKILAVETSSNLGSVALLEVDGATGLTIRTDEVQWQKAESHSEILTTEAVALLKRNNLKFKDMNLFAVGQGPGSFTGIRVGLNFIKTLAYAFQKPILTASSLDLLAWKALEKYDEVFCGLSAFRNLIYVAHFQKQNGRCVALQKPAAVTVQDLPQYLDAPDGKKILFAGDAFERWQDELSNSLKSHIIRDPEIPNLPRSSFFGSAFLPKLDSSSYLRWSETLPLYIRASEAEEKLRRQL